MSNKKNFVKDIDQIVSICNELFVDIRLDSSDVVIEEFENGLVSSIFHVRFKNSLQQQLSKCCGVGTSGVVVVNHRDRKLFETKSVVIKFFPNQENVPFEILSSKVVSIIAGIAYNQQIGPKVLLTKQDVLVISFISGRLATPEDDNDEHFFRLLATKLAQFHSMDVPIPKNCFKQKIIAVCDYWITEKDLNMVYGNSGKIHNILTENGCHNLLDGNYGEEIQFVKQCILACSYPIVFIHGDINYSNIIIMDNQDDGSNSEDSIDIRFVDFDFSAYQHRGIDLAKHFADLAESEDLPVLDDARMLRFIGYYIDENCGIYGDWFREDPNNSPKQMLKESKLFILYIYIIHINFSLWYSRVDENKMKDFVIEADKQFKGYLTAKQQFQLEKCLPNGFN